MLVLSWDPVAWGCSHSSPTAASRAFAAFVHHRRRRSDADDGFLLSIVEDDRRRHAPAPQDAFFVVIGKALVHYLRQLGLEGCGGA